MVQVDFFFFEEMFQENTKIVFQHEGEAVFAELCLSDFSWNKFRFGNYILEIGSYSGCWVLGVKSWSDVMIILFRMKDKKNYVVQREVKLEHGWV